MNYEQKSNLEKALLSQTWNKNLAKAVVSSIEAELLKAKPQKAPSALQLAVEKEKGKQFRSGPDISDESAE